MALLLPLFSSAQLFWVQGAGVGAMQSYDFELDQVISVHDSLAGPLDLGIIDDLQKLVWTDTIDTEMYVSNFDGSGFETFVNVGEFKPFYIDLDEPHERLFLTQVKSGDAFVADYYGTVLDTVYFSDFDQLRAIAYDPVNNILGMTTMDNHLIMYDMTNDIEEIIDFGLFNPIGQWALEEIKFREGEGSGFYFTFNGKIYQIEMYEQPEQITLNSEFYGSFVYSPDDDRFFCASGYYSLINDHEGLISGPLDIDEIWGELFLKTSFPLGIDLYGDIPASFDTPQTLEMVVYPNLVESSFFVESEEQILSLQLFDSMGRIAFSSVYSPSERLEVDMSGFESGVYVAVVETKLGVSSHRVVKR